MIFSSNEACISVAFQRILVMQIKIVVLNSLYSLMQPMRVNTPETVNAALNWMSRWRPAGTTNLSKALGIAMSRISADCIYLFTEGRSDKPVLVSRNGLETTNDPLLDQMNPQECVGSELN
jgi:hypothetical protein